MNEQKVLLSKEDLLDLKDKIEEINRDLLEKAEGEIFHSKINTYFLLGILAVAIAYPLLAQKTNMMFYIALWVSIGVMVAIRIKLIAKLSGINAMMATYSLLSLSITIDLETLNKQENDSNTGGEATSHRDSHDLPGAEDGNPSDRTVPGAASEENGRDQDEA